MKRMIKLIAGSVAVAMPALCFAQHSNPALTRPQVREQLIQLERAGYNPARKDNTYPTDVLSAEARVSADASGTAVGGVPSGEWQSGHRIRSARWNALYRHH